MVLRPGTGEAFDEKIVGASDERADAAAGDGCQPSTYVYCRAIFLRAVSVAFLAKPTSVRRLATWSRMRMRSP